jgi:hypothetical protein
MTPEWIKAFYKAREDREATLRRHEEEKSMHSLAVRKLQSHCDHRNPDGSSAVANSFIANYCTICSWSDI